MPPKRTHMRSRKPLGATILQDSSKGDEVVGDVIDRTLAVWQKRTDRTLTREDGREILSNMTGFLRILQEWDRVERAKASAPSGG